MTVNDKGGADQGVRWRRAAVWAGVIALILLVPAVAMRFSDEVVWTPFDFMFAGGLMGAVAVAYELAASRGAPFYRAGAGVALAAGFMLVWINGAVGIIGGEDEPVALLFGGVPAVGLAGGMVARFRAGGLAAAMAATAVAQALVVGIALLAGWGADEPQGPVGIVVLNGFFIAMWLASAWLFRKAAQG